MVAETKGIAESVEIVSSAIINIPSFATNLSVTYCQDNVIDAQGNYLDYYNINATFVNYPGIRKSNDATPTEVFDAYKQSQFNRVLDVNSLKQLYSNDDSRFLFGNPKFFID